MPTLKETDYPPIDDPTLPSYECMAYRKRKYSWMFISDFLAGASEWYQPAKGIVNEKKAQSYLPKEEGEHPEDWKFRVSQTPFSGRPAATVNGFANLLTNFTHEDLHPQLEEHLENWDKSGNSLTQFAKNADCHALSFGVSWIGVEYSADSIAQNRAEEKERGSRSWSCLYHPLNVINWDAEYVNGKEVLKLLVIKRQQAERKGYGATYKTLYRVYVPGQWIDFEIVKKNTTTADGKRWVAVEQGRGELSQDLIPVVPYYGAPSLAQIAPPLYNVFDLTLREYNLASDYYACLHACNRAVPVTIGRIVAGENPASLPPLVISSRREIAIPAGGDFKFAEPTGNALAATATSRADIDKAIDRESLQFAGDRQGEMTATEAELHAKATEGTLMGLAEAKESAFQTVFMIGAGYFGSNEDGGKLVVNKSLLSPRLTPDQLVMLYNNSLISQESAVKRLSMLGTYPDPEEELKRLIAEAKLNEPDIEGLPRAA